MLKLSNTLIPLIVSILIGITVVGLQTSPLNSSKVDSKKPSSNSKQIFISSKFLRLEFSLLNKTINYPIEDSINLLTSNVEKDYLNAILHKRKSKYGEAYKLLIKHFSILPEYFNFYDELIFAAKASRKFDELKNNIIPKIKGDNKYLKYVKALIFYHSNEYSKATDLLQTTTDSEPLMLLSHSYRGLGDYEKAVEILKKCKSQLEKNNPILARLLISEGSLYLLSGDYESAKKLYNEGLILAQSSSNEKESAKANINLAIIDDLFGNISEARIKFNHAIKLSNDVEDQELQAIALSELAVSYTYTNELIDARKNYSKSYEIFKELNNYERLSNLSSNIGSLYSQISNHKQALKFYNDGLAYAGENINSQILNLRGLGDVYANLSNYSKSIEYYKKAKELSIKIKDVKSEISADLSLGTLQYNINNPLAALNIFLDCKIKLNGVDDPYLQEEVLFKIGLVYSALGSLEQSHEYFSAALKISESVQDVYYESLISTELAFTYYRQNELVLAEKLLLSTMKKSNANGFTQLLASQNIYLGRIAERRNNLETAIHHYTEAAKIASRTKDYNNILESEFLLGKVFETKNELDKAEQHYLNAINLTDKIAEYLVSNSEIQISHFSGLDDSFNALIEIYFSQNKVEEAFTLIERSRSRNTLQNLSMLKRLNSSIDPNTLATLYDLKWKINYGLYTKEESTEFESEYSMLMSSHLGKDERLTDYKFEALSLKLIQKNLSKDESIVSYYLGEKELYVIVISSQDFKLKKSRFSIVHLSKLLSEISSLYGSIKNEDIYLNQDLFSFNSKASFELYKYILEPVIKDIKKGNKLIFSVPSELLLLPFEFMVTKYSDDTSPYFYDDKQFLIDDYIVSYTPSASIFVLQKNRKLIKTASNVLLVGDPKLSKDDFSISYRGGNIDDETYKSRNLILFPLKYSKEEILGVDNYFSNTTVLLSDRATEKNFKQHSEASSIIHLSTHSFLYKNQPLILFSKDDQNLEDGYLEAGEIAELNLDTDLIVLSSCRSGLGYIDDAEGIVGMQKAFFEAGAKSIIVSLWDVNDKYTSLFMKSFYEYLSNGYTKSEALRKAKIYFKNNYSSNPYYWSAFILAGDISKPNVQKSSNYKIFVIIGLSLIFLIFAYMAYLKLYKRKYRTA